MTGHAFPDINESHAYWLTDKHIKVLMQILKVHLWTVMNSGREISSARGEMLLFETYKTEIITYIFGLWIC